MNDRPVYDGIVRVSKVGYRAANLHSDKEQESMVRAAIEARGGVVGVIHVERDVSGKTTNRKALKAAKARVMAGDAHGLVAAYVSRFSRNTVEGLELVSDILGVGREFIALDCGGMDFRTPAGELFLTNMLAQARLEWRMRKSDLDKYRGKAIERGVAMHERFGYRKQRNGVLALDAFEAPYVLATFERRAAGASWPALAAWLNAEGVKPHLFSTRRDGEPAQRKRGTHWTPARVKDMVESRTYLGEAKSGEFVNPTAHEPIVSVALFDKCEALRDLRPRRGAAEYDLSGIARCAECGGPMKGTTTYKTITTGQRMYRYYDCASCPRKVNADRLEAAVLDMFADVARGLRAYAVERTGTLDGAMAHLADCEAMVAEAGADLETKTASRAAYLAGIAEAERRLLKARDAVRVTRQRVTGVSITDEDLAGWTGLPVDARRRFLAEAFECVYVSPDRKGWAPVGRGELADAEHVTRDFLAIV